MSQRAALLAIVGLLAAGMHAQYKLSRGRRWSPLWGAFSLTGMAALYLVAGTVGYNLSKHTRLVTGSSWSTGPIWSEIGVGLALAPLAALFWRIGLRSITPARGSITPARVDRRSSPST